MGWIEEERARLEDWRWSNLPQRDRFHSISSRDQLRAQRQQSTANHFVKKILSRINASINTITFSNVDTNHLHPHPPNGPDLPTTSTRFTSGSDMGKKKNANSNLAGTITVFGLPLSGETSDFRGLH